MSWKVVQYNERLNGYFNSSNSLFSSSIDEGEVVFIHNDIEFPMKIEKINEIRKINQSDNIFKLNRNTEYGMYYFPKDSKPIKENHNITIHSTFNTCAICRTDVDFNLNIDTVVGDKERCIECVNESLLIEYGKLVNRYYHIDCLDIDNLLRVAEEESDKIVSERL